jgi:adenylate cyclase class 2
MFEIEQKYHIGDPDSFRGKLRDLNAVEQPIEVHADTYYNHPCRDFVETKEAFRIRRVDGRPMVTYKGPKLPGTVKARRELEWRLDPGDNDGANMEELLHLLSFRRIATVKKTRHPFALPDPLSDLCVVVDDVERLGFFAEIETLAPDEPSIQAARIRVQELAERLGLRAAEPKSYLTMALEQGIV